MAAVEFFCVWRNAAQVDGISFGGNSEKESE